MLYTNMAREECAASAMLIMKMPVTLFILRVSRESLWPTSILNQGLSGSIFSNWHCFAETGPHSPGCFSSKLLSQYISTSLVRKNISLRCSSVDSILSIKNRCLINSFHNRFLPIICRTDIRNSCLLNLHKIIHKNYLRFIQ